MGDYTNSIIPFFNSEKDNESLVLLKRGQRFKSGPNKENKELNIRLYTPFWSVNGGHLMLIQRAFSARLAHSRFVLGYLRRP